MLAYKQYNPDVITLDITMPRYERNGWLLREIKDYDPDAKAVMITGQHSRKKL